MITRALFVRLEAKTGREHEVERFLRSALDIVDTEDGTPLWFALRFGPSTFGIFDAFPDEDAREAHLSGSPPGSRRRRRSCWPRSPRSSASTCSPARSTSRRRPRSSSPWTSPSCALTDDELIRRRDAVAASSSV